MYSSTEAIHVIQKTFCITENENRKQSTDSCQDLFSVKSGSLEVCKILDPDLNVQILTAFCTLLCVLVFCNTKRLLYYMDGFCTTVHRIGGFIDLGALQKNKKGLVLQIVIWGVLDSCTCGYKNTERASYYGL